jgi:hypothetical protein
LLHLLGREPPPECGQALFGVGEVFFRKIQIVVVGFDAAILIAPVGADSPILQRLSVGTEVYGGLPVDALVFIAAMVDARLKAIFFEGAVLIVGGLEFAKRWW